MIAVYQILFSNAEIDIYNATEDRSKAPRIAAWSRMMLGAGKWNEEYAKLYEKVAEVDTEDLNEVFDVTNGYGTASIKRLKRGRSGSVGDIFVKDGNCYIVDNFGFVNVGKYKLGE